MIYGCQWSKICLCPDPGIKYVLLEDFLLFLVFCLPDKKTTTKRRNYFWNMVIASSLLLFCACGGVYLAQNMGNKKRESL